MSSLYLIDGMSVVFRAYHAMSQSGLVNKTGEPTFAVFAFVNILTSLLEREKPEKIAVVFDTSAPTFRHIMFEDYKANREEFPRDLIPQLQRIKEFITLVGIPQVELDGYEADDIIGTLSLQASLANQDVICITSDKDYYQLVNKHVKLYKPSRTKSEDFDVVTEKEVLDKFGVKPHQVVEVMALIGDSVDNVPGVKGIGEKTAIPLIQEFETIENLYANIDKIERKAVKSKLESDKSNAFLSKELVTIKLDVPVDFTLDHCNIRQADYNKLDAFFAEMGFNTIRKKWQEKSGATPKDEILTSIILNQKDLPKNIQDVDTDYVLVESISQLAELIRILEKQKTISFDTETSSLDRLTCKLVGMSIAYTEGQAYYIPVWDDLGKTEIANTTDSKDLFSDYRSDSANYEIREGFLSAKEVIPLIKPILESQLISKVGQNLKFDLFIMKRYGVNIRTVGFDTMLASYVLNSDESHNLDALASKWLNYEPVKITTLIGEKKKDQISMMDLHPNEVRDYACEDADVALRLANVMQRELSKTNLEKLAYDIEIPLVEVLTQMEYNGIAIDTIALKSLSKQIEHETSVLTENIFKESGMQFNIDSPKQIGEVLFEKLMLPVIKRTKTGYSTDVQVLEALAPTYPIANMILEYRSLVKLRSTYLDALPKMVNPSTGRIHTTYNQTVASTGRLSSTDPNLQNIPIRTELGRKVRMAFVPQNKNSLILSADYSQIELRIMAYYSGDRHLVDAFKNGLDIHSATAATLFGIEIDKVTSENRRVAKTVNFGIMYGLGAFGLAQRLGISRTEGKRIIDNYFEKYPGIKRYMDETIKKTEYNGFAETLYGRRRYFPDIKSKNRVAKTQAERAAINMPIQGTASDMMKIAMLNVYKSMNQRNLKSLMMLQVHDELVFEVVPDEIDILTNLVKAEMSNALPLGEIPIVVDSGIGSNWYEAH